MKRILIFMTIVLALSVLMPTVVYAKESPQETSCKICETVKTVDKVKDCKAIVVHGNVFVAVKLGGIATKTTAEQTEEKIKTVVKETYPCITQVYVSTSVKAFAAMEDFEKGVKLHEIVEIFGIDMKSLFPPRDVEIKPDTTTSAESGVINGRTEDFEEHCQKEGFRLPFGKDGKSRPQALPYLDDQNEKEQ